MYPPKMARCFDHVDTVLAQLTAAKGKIRQGAEDSLMPDERWYAGEWGTVKIWFRKDSGRVVKEEAPRGVGWGPALIGYNCLLFRARDLASKRGLLANAWPDYPVEKIRDDVNQLRREHEKREEQEREEQKKVEQEQEREELKR